MTPIYFSKLTSQLTSADLRETELFNFFFQIDSSSLFIKADGQDELMDVVAQVQFDSEMSIYRFYDCVWEKEVL